jgi:predicted N-formylglutamate amidohydrolase
MKIITTCEHGGNHIPGQYRDYFTKAAEDLNSHLGIDFGALDVFRDLTGKTSDFSIYSEVSRLLVDLNRSLNSPTLFSIYTRDLPDNIRKMILAEYYFPYRDPVVKNMKGYFHSGEMVIHISVHSFTPVLNGETRKTDIGLLYDPDSNEETEFCKIWKRSMEMLMPEIKVMYNYPYPGIMEGFTRYLRELFPLKYTGIELEINQKFNTQQGMDKKITGMIIKSFEESIKTFTSLMPQFD